MSDKEAQAANKWQKMAQEAQKEESLAEEALTQEIEEVLDGLDKDEQIEWLKERLIEVQESSKKDADRVVRTMAEMENLRRRTDRDIESARKFATEKLLKALFPVVDSMDRGLQALVGDDAAVVAAREGLSMTRSMMLTALEQHGIELIDPETGTVFDPTLHEAVSMQPQDGVPANAVVNVLQPGYLLNGRVVRAAMVIVTPA